ncbi:MAG: MFS transporter [Isosphaeraceae bacterium]
MATSRTRQIYALGILFAINAINFFDRQLVSVVSEPIRREWDLSDIQVGWLTTAFTLLYAVMGVPLGRLADRAKRTRLLAIGVLFWSVMTATTAFTRNFAQMFAARLGVGVGEAACAPASTSLIGDLFPPRQRGKALSVFLMGLPIGLALSSLIGSQLAASYGWRRCFLVAGVPGVFCALGVMLLREPERGQREELADVGSHRRTGSPYRIVLSTPTMGWIILSGALHNFSMYAVSAFLMPYLMRYHEAPLPVAGRLATSLALVGIPGLLLGGFLGDLSRRSRINGGLLTSAWASLAAAPMTYLALGSPRGDLMGFAFFLALANGLMYVYYSTVYSAIQDVIEPSLRGTAMALYFCAMYVVGASFGPVATGFLSDRSTKAAATNAGVMTLNSIELEPFRGAGLRSAMYLVPILEMALAIVLFAAAYAIRQDSRRLLDWMDSLDEPPASHDAGGQDPTHQADSGASLNSSDDRASKSDHK